MEVLKQILLVGLFPLLFSCDSRPFDLDLVDLGWDDRSVAVVGGAGVWPGLSSEKPLSLVYAEWVSTKEEFKDLDNTVCLVGATQSSALSGVSCFNAPREGVANSILALPVLSAMGSPQAQVERVYSLCLALDGSVELWKSTGLGKDHVKVIARSTPILEAAANVAGSGLHQAVAIWNPDGAIAWLVPSVNPKGPGVSLIQIVPPVGFSSGTDQGSALDLNVEVFELGDSIVGLALLPIIADGEGGFVADVLALLVRSEGYSAVRINVSDLLRSGAGDSSKFKHATFGAPVDLDGSFFCTLQKEEVNVGKGRTFSFWSCEFGALDSDTQGVDGAKVDLKGFATINKNCETLRAEHPGPGRALREASDDLSHRLKRAAWVGFGVSELRGVHSIFLDAATPWGYGVEAIDCIARDVAVSAIAE